MFSKSDSKCQHAVKYVTKYWAKLFKFPTRAPGNQQQIQRQGYAWRKGMLNFQQDRNFQ